MTASAVPHGPAACCMRRGHPLSSDRPMKNRCRLTACPPRTLLLSRIHLAMLRINSLVPTRHGILQNLLDANGAPANAINLAMAQDVYFRGMWMALSGLRTRLVRQQRLTLGYAAGDVSEASGTSNA
jgi:hypothetical protein